PGRRGGRGCSSPGLAALAPRPFAPSCRVRERLGCRSPSVRPSCELGDPFAFEDGVSTTAQDETGSTALVDEVRAELLEREAAEARGERPSPHPAVETPARAVERRRVERLPVVAGQDEVEALRGAGAPGGAHPLDDEGCLVR